MVDGGAHARFDGIECFTSLTDDSHAADGTWNDNSVKAVVMYGNAAADRLMWQNHYGDGAFVAVDDEMNTVGTVDLANTGEANDTDGSVDLRV